jgi:hypothetical protein
MSMRMRGTIVLASMLLVVTLLSACCTDSTASDAFVRIRRVAVGRVGARRTRLVDAIFAFAVGAVVLAGIAADRTAAADPEGLVELPGRARKNQRERLEGVSADDQSIAVALRKSQRERRTRIEGGPDRLVALVERGDTGRTARKGGCVEGALDGRCQRRLGPFGPAAPDQCRGRDETMREGFHHIFSDGSGARVSARLPRLAARPSFLHGPEKRGPIPERVAAFLCVVYAR